MKFEQLRHKNEAIKHVHIKLNSSPGTISDELVGTVLTLASFEVSIFQTNIPFIMNGTPNEIATEPNLALEPTRGI